MIGIAGEGRATAITLVTDAFIVRGSIFTRHRRITDMLNAAEQDFLVMTDTVFVEFGSSGQTIQSDFAQVNLNAVLFGVADESVEPTPELRVPKVSERAFISVPPFTITGHIHLLPTADLREALEDLIGRFIPVTEATYWSDRAGEAKATALVVAVNHNRAQILAPHRESDPWAGIDRSAVSSPAPGKEGAAGAGGAADPAWPEADRPKMRRLGQRPS